jgi:uncharacterized protein YkwD
LTNQKRSNNRIAVLRQNPKLNQAAYLKAQDMIKYDYFAHTSPSGKTPWYWLDRVGYNYKTAGENLAIDFVNSQELFQAWYSSSTHRANIINPGFRDIGMAVVRGDFKGRQTTVVAQYFGTQMRIPSADARTVTTEKTSKTISRRASYPQRTYTYKPRYVSTPGGMTLYDYYRQKGKSLPSLQERARLYESFGLGEAESYYGAGWQNALLLNKLLEADEKKEATKKTAAEEQKKKEKETSEKKVTEETVVEEEKTPTPTPEETEIQKEEIAREIEVPPFIQKAEKEDSSFRVKTLSFVVRHYDLITRNIFLVVFFMVFMSLCIDVFVKVGVQHKDIILRGTIYSLILLTFILLDQAIIVKFIPHSLGVL